MYFEEKNSCMRAFTLTVDVEISTIYAGVEKVVTGVILVNRGRNIV